MAFARVFILWETRLVDACENADSACVEEVRVGRGWTVNNAVSVCVAVSVWCFTTFVRKTKAYGSVLTVDNM